MSGRKTKTPLFRHVIRSLLQYIVPLVVVGVALNIFSIFLIYQRELDRMQYELDASANDLANYFEQVERFAFDISVNEPIQNLLRTNQSPYISPYAQASAFDSFMGLNRYYDLKLIHIGILALDQTRIFSVGYVPVAHEESAFSDEEQTTEKWVLSGRIGYQDRTSKLYDVVSYYRTIYYLAANKNIGTVRVDVNTQVLRSFFDSTGSNNLRDLYFQQGDTLVPLFSEEAVPVPVSKMEQPRTISSRITGDFVLVEKFDTRTLVYENNFIAPLFIFSLVFVLLFILLSYRLTSNIIAPVYMLNETLSTMSSDDPVSKLGFKKGSPEIRVIFDGFNQLVDSLNEYITKNREILHQEQLAKTLYIQSQINPHFLYNTLDALRWIALKNKDAEAAGGIYNLSNIYRYYLNAGDSFVSIREELQLIDTYMAIQAIRFGEKFAFQVDIDEADMSFPIPKLLLQPLIENSVLHGFPDRECGCQILLSVKRYGDKLAIRVLDNGCGIKSELLQKIRNNELPEENSYAIINVKKRLDLYYGSSAGIVFHSRSGRGTFIRIMLPGQEKGARGKE